MLMIEIDLEVCFDPSKTAPTALRRSNMLIEIDFNVRLDSLKTEIDLDVCFDPSKTAPTILSITIMIEIILGVFLILQKLVVRSACFHI